MPRILKEIKLFLLAVTPRFYTPQKRFFNSPLQKKLAEKNFVMLRIKNSRCLHRWQIFLVSKTLKEKRVGQGLVGKLGKKNTIFFFLLLNNQM